MIHERRYGHSMKSWGEGITRRSDACLESIAHRKRKVLVVRRNWRGKPLFVGFRELARGHFRLQHAVDKRLELGVILSKHQTVIEEAAIDVRQKAKCLRIGRGGDQTSKQNVVLEKPERAAESKHQE